MKRITLALFVLFTTTHIVYPQNFYPEKAGNQGIIEQAMNEISPDSVTYFIQSLQNMGTRFLIAENRKAVASWIKEKFHSFGITNVVLDSFQCYTNINYQNLHYDTTTWQYNVVATLKGSLYPDEISIVCGHHDDVVVAGDPELFAPGADDNASGTAAVLESARVIMEIAYQPESTIRFITFAAEELMYFGDAGSEYYAAKAADSGHNIKMVVNNDMIAYDDGSWEIGISNVIGSEAATGIACFIAENYTTLNLELWPPSYETGADLQPFLDEGYQGVYLMESVFNPHYHKESDLIENCDIPYCTEVIKISCGSLLYNDLTVDNKEMAAMEKTSVFPNPACGPLNINNQSAFSKLITLTDLHGNILHAETLESRQTIQLNTSGYANGIYLMKVAGNKGTYTTKISVMN